MMRVHSVHLTKVKRFDDRAFVFEPGLNLVLGPNGAGKSTLHEALVFALTERYGNEQVRAWLAPLREPSARPSVTLEFTIDGTVYKLSKCFGSQKPQGKCVLEVEGRTVAGDEAVAELRELLMFDEPAGRKGNLGIQTGLPRLFWVEQGASTEVQGSLDAARTVLEPLLGLGTHVEIEAQAASLRDRVEAERKRLEGSRSSRSEVRVLEEEIARVRQTRDAVRQQLDGLEDLRLRLRRHEKDLDTIEQGDQDGELERQLAHAREEREHLHQRELARKDLEVERERLVVEGRRLEELRARDQECAVLRQRCEDQEDALAAKRGRLEELVAQQRLLRERHDAARTARTMGARKRDRRLALDQRVLLEQQRAELAQQAADRSEIEASIAALEEQIRGLALGPGLERFDELERRALTLDELLEQGAARVEVNVHQPGVVRLDGTALDDSTIVAVTGPHHLEVPGVVEATLVPQENATALERERDEVRASLEQELRSIGAHNVHEVRERKERLDGLSFELRLLRAKLEGIDSVDSLAVRAREIERQLGTLPVPEEGDLDLPPASQLAEELRAYESAETDARIRQEEADVEVAGAQEEIERMRTQLAQDKGRLGQLDQEIRGQPFDQDALARVQRALDSLDVERRELEREIEASSQVVQTIDRLQERLDRLRRSREELRRTVQFERAELRQHWPEASLEELDVRLGELEMRERELRRRIAGLGVLVEVIDELVSSTRAQLEAPVRARVEHYLVGLEPQVAVALDERHGPGSIRLGGLDYEFGRLSFGTREQVALLSRFALADVLSEKGVPLFLMLDDALLHADLVRLSWMKDVLIEVAARHQVIVFSCRSDLFVDLPAHRIELSPTG